MGKEVKIAKQVIIEEIKKHSLEIEQLLLFGSRSRDDFDKDSDWDFFVIVDRDIDYLQKRKIILNIRRKLSEMKLPTDIIIQSKKIVEQRKTNTGYLTYYVMKKGIRI